MIRCIHCGEDASVLGCTDAVCQHGDDWRRKVSAQRSDSAGLSVRTREARSYPSDDMDLDRCDNELYVFSGESGDWYVGVRKIGEKFGPAVRFTTSGAPRGREHVALAVFRLFEALETKT